MSIERWIVRRRLFWTRLCSPQHFDRERFNSEYLRTIEGILSAKAITVWLAPEVNGLLLAAWLTFLVCAKKTNCQIELVQFPRKAGPRISNMPGEIIATPPRSTPIVGATAEFLNLLWHAWSAPSPCLLLELFAKAKPHLHQRFLLSLLLDRYPNAKTGLSRIDYVLLRNVQDNGPRLHSVIGNTLSESVRSFDNVGDLHLRSRLIRLAGPAKKVALVTILRDDNNLQKEKVSLTQLGSDVLAGRANALDFAIRTDWIGGTRIIPSRPTVWVRTPDGLIQRRRTL